METQQGIEAGDLQIAGFWRRLVAFAIDVFVLGMVGLLIGIPLFDALARMGGYALIIGFALALLYFGVGNSRLMNGQTLGKMALGVRVVDREGRLLELPRSLLRYAVLGLPFFLGNIPDADPLRGFTPVVLLQCLGVAGVFAETYLYIFNRRTRQSLHDLVLGTYVVRAGTEPQQAAFGTPWKGHWVGVAVVVALCLLSPAVMAKLSTTDTFRGLLSVAAQLSAQPHARRVGVMQSASSFNGGPFKHSLNATVWLDAPLQEDAEVARGFAKVIGRGEVDLSHEDAVFVTLVYGYNLGIARSTLSHSYRYEPAELTAQPVAPAATE
ncbi:RDD family protein [Dyella sp. C9]|uniref:RDD family protein n=1 Tax=Dyella sp. C9 TaxID=2202154 RepID=UPI00130092DF|nr:RDD family protein [Dyella sp. C9]